MKARIAIYSRTNADGGQKDGTLGLGILQNLVDQRRGKLTIRAEKGTQVSVVFPTRNAN